MYIHNYYKHAPSEKRKRERMGVLVMMCKRAWLCVWLCVCVCACVCVVVCGCGVVWCDVVAVWCGCGVVGGCAKCE